MGKKYGFSFSWKRATGISSAKQRISRFTGIPLTKQGRQRKLGRIISGGSCMFLTLFIFSSITFLAICINAVLAFVLP